MQTYRIEGVVIKTRKIGERDKLLTILTQDRGKITVIAKGARRLSSKKAPFLDLFHRNIFVLAKGRSLDILTDVKPLNSYSNLRSSLLPIAKIYYACEILDRFTEEGQEDKGEYAALDELLDLASSRTFQYYSDHILVRYQLILLSSLGYHPELSQCVVCRKNLIRTGNTFSSNLGGLVCHRCSLEKAVVGSRVSPTAIKVMRFLIAEPTERVKLLALSPGIIEEVQGVVDQYIEWVLERRVNSTSFLQEVLAY